VSVVLTGRTESKLQSTYEQIVKAGGQAAISVGDAATPEGNKKFVDDALSKFNALHIAINNAAVHKFKKLVDVTPQDVNEVVGTNINSIIYGLKYQLPAIGKYSTAEVKGVIINVSSLVSSWVRRSFSHGNSLYQSSKAAVDMLTKIGALEAAEYNIRVVAINPAIVHSAMSAQLGERYVLFWLHSRHALTR
jgi:NAD(P)-dependent dehydrogenase (short-subunit alcohol dehydrogenase family)